MQYWQNCQNYLTEKNSNMVLQKWQAKFHLQLHRASMYNSLTSVPWKLLPAVTLWNIIIHLYIPNEFIYFHKFNKPQNEKQLMFCWIHWITWRNIFCICVKRIVGSGFLGENSLLWGYSTIRPLLAAAKSFSDCWGGIMYTPGWIGSTIQ